MNGTWVDDRRLRAEEPTPFVPGSRARVGPYELVLRAPEVSTEALALAGAAALGATTRGIQEVASPPPQETLALYSVQETVSSRSRQ